MKLTAEPEAPENSEAVNKRRIQDELNQTACNSINCRQRADLTWAHAKPSCKGKRRYQFAVVVNVLMHENGVYLIVSNRMKRKNRVADKIDHCLPGEHFLSRYTVRQ